MASTQAVQAGKGGVFSKLGPQIHQHEQVTPTGTQEQSQPLPVQVPPAASSNTPIVAIKQVGPSVAPNGWITMESRRKSNKHTRSTFKGKEVIVVEAVFDENPCPNLVPSAYSDVVVSIIYASAVVVSECASAVLEVAPSFLEPPNLGEGILAKIPSEVPLLGNPVKTNGTHI